MGFLNNIVPFSFIVWGQAHIASGVASILNATTPLFSVLVAHFCASDEALYSSTDDGRCAWARWRADSGWHMMCRLDMAAVRAASQWGAAGDHMCRHLVCVRWRLRSALQPYGR